MRTYFSSFRQLIVWKEAQTLSMLIYEITDDYPTEERFGLVSQMRRAALSVQANIAEGNERISVNDRIHFFVMSKSSLVEVDNFIEFSYQRNLISKKVYDKSIEQLNKTAYLLRRFMIVQKTKVGNRQLSSASSASFIS